MNCPLFWAFLGLVMTATVSHAAEPQSFPASCAVFSEQFTRVSGADKKPFFQLIGADSTVELLATGTSLSVACLVGSPESVEAQVDGGAWKDITPATVNAATSTRVFAGLADARHVVTLRCKKPAHFLLAAGRDCFTVEGKAPAVGKPESALGEQYVLTATKADAVGRMGILDHIRAESGYGPDPIAGYDALRPLPQRLGAHGGYINYAFGALFRFRASIKELAIWTYLDGSKYALAIDGKTRPVVQAPNLEHWGWLTLATDLEPGLEHEYQITAAFFKPLRYNLGSGAIHTLRTRGGKGVVTAGRPTERPVIAFYGDSITANQTALSADAGQDPAKNDATQGWIYRLGQARSMATVKLGIGSTTVHDFGTKTGTVTKAGLEYLTTASGEARTANVTELSPPPAQVVILYGTNDMGQAWKPSGAPLESLDEFAASYRSMLGRMVKDLPETTAITCVGILPRSDFKANEIERWNRAIRAAVKAVGGPRTRYLDPRPWQLNGPDGNDYRTSFTDGLHPNGRGWTIMANRLQQELPADNR